MRTILFTFLGMLIFSSGYFSALSAMENPAAHNRRSTQSRIFLLLRAAAGRKTDLVRELRASLVNAILPNNDHKILRLLEVGANLASTNGGGQNPLHNALLQRMYQSAQSLIRGMDRDALNSQDNEGYAPLHYTLLEDYDDLAIELIERGADVNIPHNRGITPLDLIRGTGNLDLIRRVRSLGITL